MCSSPDFAFSYSWELGAFEHSTLPCYQYTKPSSVGSHGLVTSAERESIGTQSLWCSFIFAPFQGYYERILGNLPALINGSTAHLCFDLACIQYRSYPTRCSTQQKYVSLSKFCYDSFDFPH